MTSSTKPQFRDPLRLNELAVAIRFGLFALYGHDSWH